MAVNPSNNSKFFDVDAVVVRHPIGPLLARGRIGRRGDQLEVPGVIGIGADHPAAIEMLGVVFHIALALGQHLEGVRLAASA